MNVREALYENKFKKKRDHHWTDVFDDVAIVWMYGNPASDENSHIP